MQFLEERHYLNRRTPFFRQPHGTEKTSEKQKSQVQPSANPWEAWKYSILSQDNHHPLLGLIHFMLSIGIEQLDFFFWNNRKVNKEVRLRFLKKKPMILIFKKQLSIYF